MPAGVLVIAVGFMVAGPRFVILCGGRGTTYGPRGRPWWLWD